MKAFFEEYGRFIVSVMIGIALLGVLYGSTIENTRVMSRLIPDERNMALSFLKNSDVVDSKQIPKMEIVNSIVILINPGTTVTVDWASKTIVHKLTDGQGHDLVGTEPNYISMKDARDKSKLIPGQLNIIGTDAVNAQVKGDYTVTYFYENPDTGYKNVHDLVVCVRRPYIPYEYIQATGTQQIDTGYVPTAGATTIQISYAPTSVNGRQDIIWTTGDRMKYGIFIQNGYWGYSCGDEDVITNLAATTSRQEVKLDTVNRKFHVGTNTVDIPATENVANGWMQIFKTGQTFGKLYSVDIYENQKLKASMFPAYSKSDNSIGMWDTVSWSAFLNIGEAYPLFEYGKELDE